MESKNLCNSLLKACEGSSSIRVRKRNTLCLDRNQAGLLEEDHLTRLLLCDGEKKCCDEEAAIRLDIIIADSLYPRIFTKQQQKILKEALKKCKDKERLYVK